MSQFFTYFPTLVYEDKVVKDITRRVKILDDVRDDPYAFLPYTVNSGETPEEIAQLYYGDAIYSWLVFLSNDIVDPYTQWVKTQDALDATIAKKYESNAKTAYSLSNITERKVIEWTLDATRTDNIVYYEYIGTDESEIQERINRDTWLYNTNIVQGDYAPIRVYDYEIELNEQYRNIKLLNKDYLQTAVKNLQSVINE